MVRLGNVIRSIDMFIAKHDEAATELIGSRSRPFEILDILL